MANMIIFFIFVGLTLVLTTASIGMYINGERGKSLKIGFLVGLFLNVFGLIILAMAPTSDQELTNEMFQRKLISKEEHDKTIEIILNKNKTSK
ncbi:MAG: hypothetical protein HRT99_03710 [Mycoplasmatales bacterium]|nr:hypothetical protein [Mycoplasmatales bacterium]